MRTVIGLFKTEDDAEKTIYDLKEADFPADDLGLLARHEAVKKAKSIDEPAQEQALPSGEEGVLAIAGITMGGYVGLMVGLSAVTLTGVGAALSAGTLALGLAGGAGATVGAVAGGAAVTFADLGIIHSGSEKYIEGIKNGYILITVSCDSHQRASEAEGIMRHHHAMEAEQLDYALPKVNQ